VNITINVDEVTLASIIGETAVWDDDSEMHVTQPRTLGDQIAAQVIDRIVKQSDRWENLQRRINDIRTEMIRELLQPVIEEALTTPFRKTSSYGEPTGEPVTLRSVIMADAQRMLTHYESDYGRQKLTVMQALVRKEVEAAFASEVRDAVKQAREQVSTEIGQMVASAVQAGLKAR
jgi:hypothetical protein